ncbi:MAG TPA: glycosyltransferase family 4 protein [Patescibacteria group bacterium]
MNIGIIAHVLSEKSGARAPIELAKSIQKRGHNVTFYAISRGKSPDAQNDLKRNKINLGLITNNGLSEMFQLYMMLRKSDHDLLITQTPLPLYLAARLTGIPIIHYYHGTQFNIFYERAFPNYNSFWKFLDIIFNSIIWLKTSIPIHSSNKTIALSKYCSQEAKKLYFKKVPTIYLGAISDHLRTGSIKNKKNTIINLLTVSRLTPYKGFHKLIEVVNKLNKSGINAKLIIAGSNPSKNYLEYLKKQKGNFEILVNPNDAQLKKLYKNSQIYISADKYLFFGMPVLEAASYQIPTVSLNFSACSEVIKNNQTGFIVNSIDEMTQKVTLLSENKTLREKMGKEANKFSRYFNWEKTALNFQKIMNSNFK